MDENMFPPMFGERVTVRIPPGLPDLMMKVTRELLRDKPPEELAYSFVAERLECLLHEKRGKDDLMDMMASLTKMDGERLIDKLKVSGYTTEQLSKSARTIQKRWTFFKNRDAAQNKSSENISKTNDNETVTGDLINTFEDYGVILKSANRAATSIQKFWRKHRESTQLLITDMTDSMEELDYEIGSDDMERTNVVKKGQRDYVPPIPDFIDDLGLFKDQSVTNITNLLNNDKISVHYEDDDSNLD